LRQLVIIIGATGFAIALASEIPLGYQLWRATRMIPDLPLSIRLNPFNILASRDRWTPEIAMINRRMVVTGVIGLGFVILTLLLGLTSLAVG